MSIKSEYYFVNPHGHTTRGIRWDGLFRDNTHLTLQEVIDAAKKEFPNVPFYKLLLFPGHGTFALGLSERTKDQSLKTLAKLIEDVELDFEGEGEIDFNEYEVISYAHGVFAEPEMPPFM